MQIKIYYRPHILLAAEILVRQLTRLGHEASLVEWVDPNDTTLHIIYCAFIPEQLPPNYIVYQTEVPGSHWFNDHYKRALWNAKAIWDYNVGNVAAYSHLKDKTSVVTPGINPIPKQSIIPKKHPFFYGAINERRKSLLRELGQVFGIYTVENLYGDEIRAYLHEAKIVLNFHYYPNAPLEVFRINEALSFGCHIISEPGAGMERYREQVYFCSQPAEFRAAIDKALSRDFNYDLTGLDNFEEVKNAMKKL